jgi:opacity protein-like surface antigen
MTIKLKALAIPAIMLLTFPSVQALADAPGAYVGLGYGQYRFEFDNGTDTDFSDKREVLKAYVGGMFTDAVGLELTYLNFDEANDNDIDADIDGWSLAGIFAAPISENFSIYGKLGWLDWEADLNGEASAGPVFVDVSNDIDGTDVFYGAGARFGLSDAVSLRFEYDRYKLDVNSLDPDLDILSANLQFGF